MYHKSNSVFCHTGFLDKNNDLLFRNLKEVTFTSSLCVTCLWKVEQRLPKSTLCVCLQVMCMSENKILTQCFDKEELSDKKRPDTVRRPPFNEPLLHALTDPTPAS